MRSALAAVLVPLSLTPLPAGAATEASAEVSISVGPQGAIRVPVVIQGEGPFDFMLDTGSSHSTLATELAERLALPSVAQARVSTPAGVELQVVVRVGRLSVGTAAVDALLPSLASRASLERLERGIWGVLGQDFLGGFDYTVDYSRRCLRFAVDRTEPAERLPLVRRGARSLVRLAGRRGADVLMVPDTGSNGFVLFEREGRTAVEVDRLPGFVSVSGLTRERAATAAIVRRLDVGGVTLRDQPAVVIPRPEPGAGQADGLLPLHAFSRVSWSNSEAYLAVRR
jgi:predicted aspartyl protease